MALHRTTTSRARCGNLPFLGRWPSALSSRSRCCRSPKSRSFSISSSDSIGANGPTGTARRYLGFAAATVIAVGLAVGSVNAVVDPFGTLRLIDLPGVNAYKPAMQNRVRLAKAYDVRRLKPRAIVL